ACFPSVSVFKKWRVQQQQRQYIRHVSEEQSTHAESGARDNPEGTARRTIAHRKEQQHGKSRRAVVVCEQALTRCDTPHPTGNDRQAEGDEWMPSRGTHDQHGP
ncbi:hypothetical protein TcG_09820, partial [Trypanosoma cruzi]